MGRQFMEGLIQMTVFIICAQTLMHLKPRETYEKYLKLIVNMLLLLQMLVPVREVIMGVTGDGLRQEVLQFQLQLEEILEKETAIFQWNQEEKIPKETGEISVGRIVIEDVWVEMEEEQCP